MAYRSEKQPTEIIEAALPANIQYGRGIAAGEIIQALRREGWIVVRHDAIRLAQAHARDMTIEDMHMEDAEMRGLPPSKRRASNDNDPAAAYMRRKA